MFAVSSVPFGGGTFTILSPAQTVAGTRRITPRRASDSASLEHSRTAREFFFDIRVFSFL
jgi:hypothetical protein